MEKRKGYDFWKHTLNGAKFVVAPMVDQSELAWRLLSRRYGAELCYTPMLHSSVFIRDSNYRKEGLASCQEDRPLIVQFCGNDPEVLLKAAKYAEAHVDAVDINLGCPQAIARRGHYGAFLQEEWDLLHKIVSMCASELKVPITAKIRVFKDIDKTVRYAQMLEKAGVQLLTVHGRTIEQKGVKTGLASWAHIKAVRENIKIPMFANGNIQYLKDVYNCIDETGVDGIMTAEGNLHNPGLFDGKEHKICDMANEYLELVEKYPCPLSYVRGHIFKLCHHAVQVHKNVRDALANSKTLEEIKLGVALLQECLKEDIEKYELNPQTLDSTLPHPHWICQPYVRPSESDKPETKSDKTESKIQELESLKRALSIENVIDDEVLQELSKNKLKKLKRNHRKVFIAKSKDEKFPKCGCGNPKGLRCAFECCKQCCREKAFREKLDCPGHRILVKSKTEWKDDRKKEMEQSVTDNSVLSCSDKNINTNKSNNCETVMDTEVLYLENDDHKLDNMDVSKTICNSYDQCDSLVGDNQDSVKC